MLLADINVLLVDWLRTGLGLWIYGYISLDRDRLVNQSFLSSVWFLELVEC